LAAASAGCVVVMPSLAQRGSPSVVDSVTAADMFMSLTCAASKRDFETYVLSTYVIGLLYSMASMLPLLEPIFYPSSTRALLPTRDEPKDGQCSDDQKTTWYKGTGNALEKIDRAQYADLGDIPVLLW